MEEFEHGTVIIGRSSDNQLSPKYISEEFLDDHCFLRYAVQEWHEHALAAGPALFNDDVWDSDNLGKMPTLRDTWLYRAAEGGHKAIVKLLLDRKADIDTKADNGMTPLAWAAQQGHEEIVRLLLEEGADPSLKDDEDSTPLLWAACRGKDAVVEQLLGLDGVDPNAPSNDGSTPLCWAACRGYDAVVKVLLAVDGIDLNAPSNDGITPVAWAAQRGYEEVVRLLLENGADPNAPSNDGMTPLAWAAQQGYEEIVRLLLDKGADPSLKDDEDSTPLLWAACRGKDAVVEQLLGLDGVDPNAPSNDGSTPLCWAACRGYDAVVKQLLAIDGVDINAPSNDGITPLAWAAQRGYEEVVMLLLENGADPNIKDNEGSSLIHHAASGPETTLRNVLAWKNIIIHNQTSDGLTALHIAAQRCKVSSVEALLDAGIDPNISSYSGKTALDYALEVQSGPVIGLLVSRNARTGPSWDLTSEIIQQWAKQEWFLALEKVLMDTNLVSSPERLVEASWTRTTSCRDDTLEINEYSLDIPYLEVTVQSNLPSPVRRIVFRTVSHDQGIYFSHRFSEG